MKCRIETRLEKDIPVLPAPYGAGHGRFGLFRRQFQQQRTGANSRISGTNNTHAERECLITGARREQHDAIRQFDR